MGLIRAFDGSMESVGRLIRKLRKAYQLTGMFHNIRLANARAAVALNRALLSASSLCPIKLCFQKIQLGPRYHPVVLQHSDDYPGMDTALVSKFLHVMYARLIL
jgi:hypothetical protein